MRRGPLARAALLVLLTLAACERPTCEPAAHPPTPDARYAVVSSDYGSSAIALLDAEGELLEEAFLDSGSVTPIVVAALSGDVVLPTAALGPCLLTLVDRFNTDVITFADHCEGALLEQIDVGATFRSNPQDVLRWDEAHVLVSRHERNPDPEAPPLERGNDLVRVRWRDGVVAGRYAFDALDGARQDGEGTVARPKRMALLEAEGARRVLVGLARLSTDFALASSGAVGLLDPETGALSELSLAPLVSCDEVDPIPGDPARALVACAGQPFEDEAGRRPSSGFAIVALAPDGGAAVEHVYRAVDHPEAPAFNTAAVPLDASRAFVVAMGDLVRGVPDRAFVIDLAQGVVGAPLFEAGSAFVIGEGAYDLQSARVLVPDAHLGAVRRFSNEGGTLTELDAVATGGCRGLPPREVRRIRGR